MTDYRYLSGAHDQLPNAEHVYHVGWEDLPLACPLPRMSLWNSHPRVYLPVHETGEATCEYCGARFVLKDIVLGEDPPEFTDEDVERHYHRRVDALRRQRAESLAGDARHDREEALLDEALDESFPASDPIAVSVDAPSRRRFPGEHRGAGKAGTPS